MRNSRFAIAAAVIVFALASTGCYRAVRLEQLCGEILDACPDARFERDFSLSLGGMSWGILKSIALAAEKDDPDVQNYVGKLSRIELVVYEVRGIHKSDARAIGEIIRSRLDEDWSLMVEALEDDELVWIHAREDGDHIREMQIASYDGEEFVIVRFSGSLDDIMEKAVADHGGFTDKIVGSARN
ncbi:MAG TPA: DUF4252 domain-containing protein [bacterium]|nr:DUF4252 domain-containing protein [bacterium]